MAKKKTTSKRKSNMVEAVPYKPTMSVDASKLRGQKLSVGKRANLNVRGRVIEESIDPYNPGGKKQYRIEVDKVSSPTKRRK